MPLIADRNWAIALWRARAFGRVIPLAQGPNSALRAQGDLLNRIKLMLPVQSPSQKYSRSLLTQITSISLPIPAHTKGRFAIVTDVGLGVRWTQAALLTRALSCGRRSRVVLTPRRWRQVGGAIRKRRWQTSPVTGESAK